MSRREEAKQRTRELILDAARCQFEQRGFDSTTIRAIAAAAGVAPGTIFVHFPDKLSLLVASLVDDLEAVQRRALTTMPLDVPVADQFLHFVRVGLGYWGRRPSLSRVLLKEMWFVSGAAADRLRQLDHDTMALATAALAHARQRGELRSDTDPELAARAMFAFYLTTLLQGLEQSEYDIDGMVEQIRRFVALLFTGIGVAQ